MLNRNESKILLIMEGFLEPKKNSKDENLKDENYLKKKKEFGKLFAKWNWECILRIKEREFKE